MLGHEQVGDDEVQRAGLADLEASVPVTRFENPIARPFQHLPHHAPEVRVVINDQNTGHTQGLLLQRCRLAGGGHAAPQGVPVASVQKTTLHRSTVKTVEENEGLYPHIRWTKTSDFVHVYRGILPINKVFFLTS